jgi:rubrerythrin
LEKTKTAKPIAATSIVGTTVENLQGALNGETYEYTTMYPDFKATADKEGMTDASRMFNYAMKAEKTFAGNYGDVLDNLWNGNISSIASMYAVLYRCPVCGEIVTTHPIICPICGTNGDTFVKYDMNLSGIDVPQQTKALKVYVQHGILYISELTVGYLLNVYDVSGTLIYRRPVTSNETVIPLPAKGVYIVRSGKVTMKVIN